MKPTLTTLIALVCGLGLVFVAGCEKTKADLGEDILSQMLEIQEDTMDDFFDIVDDQSDICNKTLRDTTALVDQRESQLRTLRAEWEKLQANSSTKDQREAVNRVSPDVQPVFERLRAQKDIQFAIFEEFQKNCPEQMPDVFQLMQRAAGLFTKIIGHEFV